jgi:hypothetical protein
MLSCSCLSCAIVTASVDEGYSSDAVGGYTLPRACYITLQAHVIQHPCLFRDVQWWMMALPVILKLVVSACFIFSARHSLVVPDELAC